MVNHFTKFVKMLLKRKTKKRYLSFLNPLYLETHIYAIGKYVWEIIDTKGTKRISQFSDGGCFSWEFYKIWRKNEGRPYNIQNKLFFKLIISFSKKIYSLIYGHNMKFVHGSKKIITEALLGTEMESIARLHVGTTCYLCCKDYNVTKLLAFAKKMPTLILLGRLKSFWSLIINDFLLFHY